MHLLLAQKGTIAEQDKAIDLGQSPADVIFLSAADTELASLSVAKAALKKTTSSLRLVNLLSLSHPMSVDTYVEKTASYAKLIVLRVIGGESYWPYGLQVLHSLALEKNIKLVVLPGDDKVDENLQKFSTVAEEDCRNLWHYLIEASAQNMRSFLEYCDYLLGRHEKPVEAIPLMKAGLWSPDDPPLTVDDLIKRHNATHKPVVAICFYRALVQSGQTASVEALIDALQKRGLIALPILVSSLVYIRFRLKLE